MITWTDAVFFAIGHHKAVVNNVRGAYGLDIKIPTVFKVAWNF
jgi:hypothetical protein